VAAKRRPTVVVSTSLYQATHSLDLIVALVTTQLHQATTPTDYVLQDWATAGLHRASAVRVYLETVDPTQARWLGRLTDRDWQEVQARLRLALAVI
jgi:mRNA-degrading endonuclease toxin of MazEF toxin-antitoxin module